MSVGPWPLYVSPDLGTGDPPTNDGLADEYTQRRDAGWGTGLFAYWPGSPTWTRQWTTLAGRFPQGFPLLMSPKSTIGVAEFISSMPAAWWPQVLVCYWQEPEDNHITDTARAAYRSAVAVMAGIVRPFGARNGVHVQEWMLDPFNAQPWGGPINLLKFLADPDSFDVVSWSLYTGFNGIDWLARVTRIRDFMAGHLPGKLWIIGAAGLPVQTGTAEPSTARVIRAGNVRACGDWLVANGCTGFGWFDVNNFFGNGRDNYAATDPELSGALTYVSRLEVPMPAGPYTRDMIYGVTLNLRTAEMYEKARREFGFPTVLTQGSYNTSVDQSAGTHAGGGALDVRARDLTSAQRDKVVLELRRVGFAAWLRTPSQGDWPYHVHAIAVGDKELSAAAKDQITDYYAGRNGLANNGPDDGPRQFVGVVHPQELYVSFYGPEHWNEADFDRFEQKAGWKYNIVDGRGTLRDADTLMEFIHRNGYEAEDEAKAAKLAAVNAANQAAAAQTAAAAAEQAVKNLEARLFPPA